MKDNEIIKALECCKSMVTSCEECPMHIEGVICHEYELNEKALDLIKRQQAENEELAYKLECLLWYATDGKLSKSLYTLGTMKSCVDDTIQKYCDEAKSEAVKEFAERLKKHSRKMQSSDFSGDFWDAAVLVEDIDNLVKEMVGENNE